MIDLSRTPFAAVAAAGLHTTTSGIDRACLGLEHYPSILGDSAFLKDPSRRRRYMFSHILLCFFSWYYLIFEGIRVVLFVRRVTPAASPVITAGEIDDAQVANEYVYSDVI